MLRKKRCHETTLKAAAAERVMNSLAMLFSYSYLIAVTKVTFPTIKLVRTLHIAEYDFLCPWEESCLDSQPDGGSQESYSQY